MAKHFLGTHTEGGFVWKVVGYTGAGAAIYKTEMTCPQCKEKRWVNKSIWKSYMNHQGVYLLLCIHCRRRNVAEVLVGKGVWYVQSKGGSLGRYMTCLMCGKKRWVRKDNYTSAKRRGIWIGLCHKCSLVRVRKGKASPEMFKLIDDRTFSANLMMMGNYVRYRHKEKEVIR